MKRIRSYHDEVRPVPSAILREDSPSLFGPFADDDDDDDEEMEQFYRYLRTIESEPASTLARQLIADGIELPPPQFFTEESVREKLWEVIHGLARRRHYLCHTDHFSDFSLYRYLWEVTLNQPAHELTNQMGDCACHLDMVSDGTDESLWLWLRHYADEPTRRQWAADFPGGFVPEHAPLPHDRDRHLPEWIPAVP